MAVLVLVFNNSSQTTDTGQWLAGLGTAITAQVRIISII